MNHAYKLLAAGPSPLEKAGLAATLLLALMFPLQALGNVWLDSFGQKWFYEVRGLSGKVLAGSWYNPALAKGKSYNISFDVTSMQGRMALYAGDSEPVVIDSTGHQSINFSIAGGGKQRMVFTSSSTNVVAGVSNIVVTQTGQAQASGGPPRGHYLSFARERNIQEEVIDVLAQPWNASGYHRNIANNLHGALTTPGVKGFQVTFDWRTIETGDGVYNWRLMDENIAAAEHYGLAFIVKILDRSFDGSNVLPAYFSSSRMVWATGGGNAGFVAKRWDPWVYTRIIRLYKAIANRYDGNPAFGGIATTESALGNFSGGEYSLTKYKTALKAIVSQTQNALSNGRLFWYLNFVRGDNSADMNKSARVELATTVPHQALALGGPDVTPDVSGMPGSVSSYRIRVRKRSPDLDQFCHLQHVDLGLSGRNVKGNSKRQSFLNQIARVRERESQPYFNGTPAVFEKDDLRNPAGIKVDLHPSWVLGDHWTPEELFGFADRNFHCDYVFWNYVDNAGSEMFGWPDLRPIVINTQYLYN